MKTQSIHKTNQMRTHTILTTKIFSGGYFLTLHVIPSGLPMSYVIFWFWIFSSQHWVPYKMFFFRTICPKLIPIASPTPIFSGTWTLTSLYLPIIGNLRPTYLNSKLKCANRMPLVSLTEQSLTRATARVVLLIMHTTLPRAGRQLMGWRIITCTPAYTIGQ